MLTKLTKLSPNEFIYKTNTNMNYISEATEEILNRGMDKENVLNFSNPLLRELAKEVYNVPERPKDFSIKKFGYGKEDNIAILVTGGLDSTILYFMMKKKYKNIKSYYIDIGQSYVEKEIKALDSIGIDFEYINGGIVDIEKFWKHIIPGRNLYFLSLVAEYIEGGKIMFGATNGEMPDIGGDKSKRFIKLVNKLFKQTFPYKVEVETPLENYTKTDLVKWWIDNGLRIEKLEKTISCFNEEDGHCGKCQACLRKALAFISNGLELKTNTPILEGCKEYIEKYKTLMPKVLEEKDFSHYSEKRCLQDLEAINKLINK